MNELTKDILRQLADNENLMGALKVCLLDSIDINQLDVGKLNDTDLGSEVRARIRAKEFIQVGLENIKQLQTNKVVKKEESII